MKELDSILRSLNAKAKVNVPTRPINIETIKTILPPRDTVGVMPVLNPTVQKALTSSKAKSNNAFSGSNSVNKKIPTRILTAENKNMAKALFINSQGIWVL